ncbi:MULTISPECIES: AAA family ATPase [Xenorhabdus]|uniref:AAA family ATPase n=1 Tax=Xenorhabdus TaxID=626 RepID=UPI000AE88D4B|nr:MULTISPECIES: AAA family ATPase [Xenorhabdus]
MKSIYFKSAHILSLRDKKGFFFEFSPDVNIISGENDTGKSSFIKMLYHTLGADVRLDKKWKIDNFISKVIINVKERDYVFIRHNKRISIFDITEGQKHLVTSNSRSDIAEVVSDIFDFNLELVVKKTAVQEKAKPASLYLPFYIDQDNGWGKVLDSFSYLAMYSDWQKNILHFHAGIKPKEYYKLQGEISLIDLNLEEIFATLKALNKLSK